MFDKRLFSLVPGVMRHIAGNVALQWLALLANVVLFVSVGRLLQSVLTGGATGIDLARTLLVAVVAVAVRLVCQAQATKQGLAASALAKQRVRTLVYDKLVRMGPSYRETVATSEATQLCVEGIEQLEAYFGSYLPQLFYSLIASVTLFFCLAPLCTPAAVVLLCCVPLIPISLMAVMKIAKRIMGDYWHSYTDLGALFLESIQGLTTLKVFRADEERHCRMNEEAEKFRKATMRLLTMQLNSVIVMDIFAFAGAASGIVVMLNSYAVGTVTFAGAFAFVFLAADFFIPLRTLGSFFHTATGGMAAAERMYRIIDAPEPACGTQAVTCTSVGIECRNVSYSYDGTRTVLQNADFTARPGGFVGITGASGSGKSTLAGILTGANLSYTGSVTIGGIDLRDISAESLRDTVTYVGFRGFLFAGTVRSNLLMARAGASDDELWEALSRCRIDDFVRRSGGLDAPVSAEGTNLSGGQRQRLAMARALLHDTPVYIFDEATSNIDADSEAAIIDAVAELARTKTVVMVSHRLAALRGCDKVYVFEAGRVVQTGTHEELAKQDGPYASLWARQAELEDFSARSGEGAGKQAVEQVHQAAEGAGAVTGGQVCQAAEGAGAAAGEQACWTVEDAGTKADEKTHGVSENAGAEIGGQGYRTAENAASKPAGTSFEFAGDALSQQAYANTGAATPKLGKVRVILELVKLTRPLLGVLACAVVLGVAGFLAAIGITVLATSALLDLEGQACWVAASVATVAAVACGIARGPLRYAEQLCNHYLAFRVLALVRDKVFAAMRRLAPAKLEGKEKGDLVSLVTADIELLEVFYAHTLSPAAIALTVSIIVLIFLFATTIRENLLVAKADASDEELIAALEKAALRELVERLPQGLDTQLAELGDSLSGGERQRLGLARVFLQDAPLLLLDEPTSNLDALSEASVLKALQENRADKTVVIVTHRASAGAIADDTYALSNGTLV
ncbi:MAG: ATP-binding cassette domain-containing protein [Coriobacteriaceae bacterium]|nr:ATP-binding cassette domain-containing protein [Coriobacteriaceae bacterium]